MAGMGGGRKEYEYVKRKGYTRTGLDCRGECI